MQTCTKSCLYCRRVRSCDAVQASGQHRGGRFSLASLTTTIQSLKTAALTSYACLLNLPSLRARYVRDIRFIFLEVTEWPTLLDFVDSLIAISCSRFKLTVTERPIDYSFQEA